MTNPRRTYYPSGELEFEEWYDQNREHHRTNGPAIIRYYLNGNIHYKCWIVNGTYHRISEPAYIEYSDSGKIESEEWIVNGKCHRNDGPAEIYYNEFGEFGNGVWYLNSKIIYPDDWLKENGYEWPLDDNQQTELLLRFG